MRLGYRRKHGGGAAAEAAVKASEGEIDRLILLSPVPTQNPDLIKGSKLFIASEDEKPVSRVKEQHKNAPEPKKLVLLKGSAHAQHIFKTDQSEQLTGLILEFLEKGGDEESDRDDSKTNRQRESRGRVHTLTKRKGGDEEIRLVMLYLSKHYCKPQEPMKGGDTLAKKFFIALAAILFLVTSFVTAQAYEAIVGPTGVLKYNKAKAYDGYTLFSPMSNSKTTYLVDMEGNMVHKWETDYTPGLFAMLLPNGNLLRGGRPKNPPTTIGGASGIVQEIDWNGKVVWEYKMLSPTEVQHHTFARMPNGNTLILGWEFKSNAEAIGKGRDPKTIPVSVFGRGKWHYGFWPDFVSEVTRDKRTVWEWHA